MSELNDATATLAELAGALAQGRVSGRELVERALARIADPAGEGAQAFILVDDQVARDTADFMDGLRRAGRAPSPFAGIPVSIKDLFDIAGQVTRAGSVVLADNPPAQRDAVAAARLKAMGFVVVGRSNTTEFAYSGVGLNPHYGTPKSVWDRAHGRIPGGSSAGAGVSVADGMAAIGIGTDTGGSCRIPATFNGVVGYKSSVGRVPTRGVFPLSPTLDSVGPLGRSVACCATADAIMAGDWDGEVRAAAPGRLRFGLLNHVAHDKLDRHVAADYERSLADLRAAGVQTVEIDFAELEQLPDLNAKGGITAVEAMSAHQERIAAQGERYDQRVRRRIESGLAISGVEYDEIRRRRGEMIGQMTRAQDGLDGIILPSVPVVAPMISEVDDDVRYGPLNFLCLRNTFLGNFLNQCAISLPMHRPGEPPTGLMMMARWGRDQHLFAAAEAVEAVLDASRRS